MKSKGFILGLRKAAVTGDFQQGSIQLPVPFRVGAGQQEQRAVVKGVLWCLHWKDFCRSSSGKGGLAPQGSLLPPLWARCESCKSSQQLSWAASGYEHTFPLWGQSGCWCCAPLHPSHLPDREKMKESPVLPLLLTPGWNTSWDHPATACTSVTREKSSAAKIPNLELLIKKKKIH